MPIQYADKPKQPGETIYYSMTFTPGLAISANDSLTGTPIVAVFTYPGGEDKSSEMIEPGSVSRSGNTIYVGIKNGTDGTDYKITFKCGTTNGEKDVEEDLILLIRET